MHYIYPREQGNDGQWRPPNKRKYDVKLLKAQYSTLTKELKRYQQYFPVPRVIYADLENNELPAAKLKQQVSLLHSERDVMVHVPNDQ